MNPPANWYPDPTGRHEQRYWDGEAWTEHVFTAGVQAVDPLDGAAAQQGDVGAEDAGSAAVVAEVEEASTSAAALADAAAEELVAGATMVAAAASSGEDAPSDGPPPLPVREGRGERGEGASAPLDGVDLWADANEEAGAQDVVAGGTAWDAQDPVGASDPTGADAAASTDGAAVDAGSADSTEAATQPSSSVAAGVAEAAAPAGGLSFSLGARPGGTPETTALDSALERTQQPSEASGSVPATTDAWTPPVDVAADDLPEAEAPSVDEPVETPTPAEDPFGAPPAVQDEPDADVGWLAAAPPPTGAPAPTAQLPATTPGGGVSGALLDGAYAEQESSEPAMLQNSRLLRCRVTPAQTIVARQGTMVAYQGNVTFERQGAGGVGRALKRAATGEGLAMMRVEGDGDVFFADTAQHVFLLQLDGTGSLSVNGRNVLAFSGALSWDIERIKGASMLAGGLFNTTLSGTGWVALVSDGEPVVLRPEEAPTYVDVDALVAWSGGLGTRMVNTVSAKSVVGLGSGEAFQMAFDGTGVVIVQPSEGRYAGPAAT